MYSDINPQFSYNKSLPADTSEQYEETPAFSKFQDKYGVTNQMSEYYCGGGSSAAIRGMQLENTPVSLLFFSDENIKRIQRHIKDAVLEKSKGAFKLKVDQDISDVLIVMRAIFLEHGLNMPTQIKRQVKILNKKTLDYILPNMMSNIKQQYNYIKEINNPHRNILPLLLNVNSSQRGTIPSMTTIWQ